MIRTEPSRKWSPQRSGADSLETEGAVDVPRPAVQAARKKAAQAETAAPLDWPRFKQR